MKLFRIIRKTLITLLILSVALPASLYLMLSSDWAQQQLRDTAQSALSKLMDTRLTINSLKIHPFNRLEIDGIRIYDDVDSVALDAANVRARFELWHFITTGNIVIDYVKITGPRIHLWRESPQSPINISRMIKALSKKDENKPPTKFDLAIETVAIENGVLTYDVWSEQPVADRFDKNHVDIDNLNLNVSAPRLSNNCFDVLLEHLALHERSGLTLSNMQAHAVVKGDSVEVKCLEINMPQSHIRLQPLDFSVKNISNLKDADASPVAVSLAPGSFITPADLAAFVPALANVGQRFDVDLNLVGTLREASIDKMSLRAVDGKTAIDLSGNFADLDRLPNDFTYNDVNLALTVKYDEITDMLSALSPSTALQIRPIVAKVPVIDLDLKAEGTMHGGHALVNMVTPVGRADGDVDFKFTDSRNFAFDGSLALNKVEVGSFAKVQQLGGIDGKADFNIGWRGGKMSGDANVEINSLQFKGITYENIVADGRIDADSLSVNAHVDDNLLNGTLAATFVRNHGGKPGVCKADADVVLASFYPAEMGLTKSHPGHRISGKLTLDALFHNVDEFDAVAGVHNFRYVDAAGQGLKINDLMLNADCMHRPGEITVKSDVLNGSLQGDFALSTIVPTVKDMISHVFPTFVSQEVHHKLVHTGNAPVNDFVFDFTLSNAVQICEFFKLPVYVVYPLTVSGMLNYPEHKFYLDIDAPYLQQGDKIIDSTAMLLTVDGETDKAQLNATTHMPTKKGPMRVNVNVGAQNNTVNTLIDWQIERTTPINGTIAFDTRLERRVDSEGNPLGGTNVYVSMLPGKINFGDDEWSFSPAQISYIDRDIIIENLQLVSENQKININGTVGDDPSEKITVDLENINMINIFETLDIDKALIGGYATGTIHASQLLSSEPDLHTDNLHVTDIGYNYCTLGDADVKAFYDFDKKAFSLDADIVEPGGLHSRIWGDIIPDGERLNLYFDANRVKVGFLKPFMDAFASDISGYATGKAHLFGTFKYVDLEGDVFAEDVKIGIRFTNTTYSTTDSVRIAPGRINIKNVTVADRYGHTALLNGYVKHNFFKEPSFDFSVTNADNLLCYDTGPAQNSDWYGRIFGNGAAFIKGEPGVIDIRVNMSTARNSTFTFVLSDTQVAEEYSFITFRERNDNVQVRDTILEVDDIPQVVKDYQKRLAMKNADDPSDYRMDIQMDISPDARINLVMDPVGGDAIKANGNGNMRMTYSSASGLLNMYGTYTLEKGTYNFTLQDIIIKDFTIKEGSSIAFHGSPYDAQLDIQAYYSVNANLSDLDESFLQDKDLNRTSVPVHALLKVTGDMRQPDIDFDLEFPTLASDTYRKVRSIISTDEMMNRQIIYLLALNRFYTPDYMNTTKGNELFSVASSTISSQLSSILGKLSDNWSIAPNLRSDRGDFSDLEVDVALSSHLLKNRLFINGNLGYRDKALNTNQFVGDFDIEYLLNRRGSWRLKAYNRYNDQNYYLRTATTTQGVGFSYRMDFDGLFSFLNPIKEYRQKKKAEKLTESLRIKSPVKSVPLQVDSVTVATEVVAPDTSSSPHTSNQPNNATSASPVAPTPAAEDDWLIIR